MTDKYLRGCKWDQYVLISQVAQLFYLFYLQQSEYGSSKIDFHQLTILDCKTVGFFLKISKEIGKGWRKSLTLLDSLVTACIEI